MNGGEPVRTMAYFAILMLILLLASTLMDRAVVRNVKVKQYWVLSHKGLDLDYAILGSSRGYVNVDAGRLEELLGKKVMNLSIDGASYTEQYLLLELFLRNNKVRNLLLQVDVFGLDKDSFDFPFHYYYYFPFLNDRKVFDYIKEYCGIKAYLWKYAPYLKYSSYNQAIGLSSVLGYLLKPGGAEFDSRGSLLINRKFSDETAKFQLTGFYDRSHAIDLVRDKHFKGILTLAKSKGVRTVLFMAPEYVSVYSGSDDREKIIDYYKSIAREYGIAYRTFDDEDIAGNIDLFFDLAHLNRTGAGLFTERLAGYVSQVASEGPGITPVSNQWPPYPGPSVSP